MRVTSFVEKLFLGSMNKSKFDKGKIDIFLRLYKEGLAHRVFPRDSAGSELQSVINLPKYCSCLAEIIANAFVKKYIMKEIFISTLNYQSF